MKISLGYPVQKDVEMMTEGRIRQEFMCISWIPACGLKSRERSGRNIDISFRESVKKIAVSYFTGVMN